MNHTGPRMQPHARATPSARVRRRLLGQPPHTAEHTPPMNFVPRGSRRGWPWAGEHREGGARAPAAPEPRGSVGPHPHGPLHQAACPWNTRPAPGTRAAMRSGAAHAPALTHASPTHPPGKRKSTSCPPACPPAPSPWPHSGVQQKRGRALHSGAAGMARAPVDDASSRRSPQPSLHRLLINHTARINRAAAAEEWQPPPEQRERGRARQVLPPRQPSGVQEEAQRGRSEPPRVVAAARGALVPHHVEGDGRARAAVVAQDVDLQERRASSHAHTCGREGWAMRGAATRTVRTWAAAARRVEAHTRRTAQLPVQAPCKRAP